MLLDEALIKRLRTHVERLAGDIGERNVFVPEALRRAAKYIEKEWIRFGYAVDRLDYDVSGLRCANLVASRNGRERKSEILLLGAHYDSIIGSSGANDNASGVAALLEISRMFQAVDPALTVRLVAFVNEEPPFFMTGQQGSRVYAKAARRRGDDIRLMASLETIGCFSDKPGSQKYPPLFALLYPDRGTRLGFPLAESDAALSRGLSRPFRLSAADRFDVPGHSWGVFERFTDRSGARVIAPLWSPTRRLTVTGTITPRPILPTLSYPELTQVTLGLFDAFAALARAGVG